MTTDIESLQALPEPENADLAALEELGLLPCNASGTCLHTCWFTCLWTD